MTVNSVGRLGGKFFTQALGLGRLLLPLVLIPGALAAPAARGGDIRVEGVSSPAWVVREAVAPQRNPGGHPLREPLAPGMVLHHRDQVLTGSGGSATLALPDGSVASLGEDAELSLRIQADQGGRRAVALEVPVGSLYVKARPEPPARRGKSVPARVLSLKVGQFATGLGRLSQGTEVWARQQEGGGALCFLSGQGVVVHPELAQGVALGGEGGQCLRTSSEETVPVPATQADVTIGLGAYAGQPGGLEYQAPGGRWSLVFPALSSETQALAFYDWLRDQGYPVRIKVRTGGGEGATGAVAGEGDRQEALTPVQQAEPWRAKSLAAASPETGEGSGQEGRYRYRLTLSGLVSPAAASALVRGLALRLGGGELQPKVVVTPPVASPARPRLTTPVGQGEGGILSPASLSPAGASPASLPAVTDPEKR